MEAAAELKFGEVLNKRLRNLKKKMVWNLTKAKIEKYSVQDPIELDKDQIQILAKKPEILLSIKDLEDIKRQVIQVELDSNVAHEQQQEELRKQHDLDIQNAISAEKLNSRAYASFVIMAVRALTVILPSISRVNVSMKPAEYTALCLLKDAVLSTNVLLDGNVAENHLMSIFEKSEQLFADTGLTYSQIGQRIQELLCPPAPPQFGFQEEEVLEQAVSLPDVVAVRYSDIKFTMGEVEDALDSVEKGPEKAVKKKRSKGFRRPFKGKTVVKMAVAAE